MEIKNGGIIKKILMLLLVISPIVYFSAPAFSKGVLVKKNTNKPVRFLVYNREFAQRFGLNPSKSVPLSKGLYAIEVTLDKSPNQNEILLYDCHLNLYVSSRLNIKYPGTSALNSRNENFDIIYSATAPLPKISSEDKQALSKIDNPYNHNVVVLVYKKLRGKTISPFNTAWVSYESYAKNILPGISYIQLDPGCKHVAELKTGDSIWLIKEGKDKEITKNARHGSYNRDDYYQFFIPKLIAKWRYAQYGICVNENRLTIDWEKTFTSDKDELKHCVKPIRKI